MATGGRKPVACSKMLIFSHLVNFGRNFPSSLLRWQNGLGTAWPGREPEVKRPENAEDDWWFCFRSPLSQWPVIIPAAWYCPRSIARKTLHPRPSFVDCEWVWCWRGVHAWAFEAGCDSPALAQATFTARMFICLHCDHTCLQKSLSFAPGVVVLHRLPLTPTWLTSHRSLDRLRTAEQVPVRVRSCSSYLTGKDCFLTWVDGVTNGWASGIEPASFCSIFLYHL